MNIKKRIATVVSLHYLLWLVMFVVVMAIGFMALGSYWLLVPITNPASAAFIVGGGLIGVLIVLAIVVWAIRAIRQRAARHAQRQAVAPRQSQPEEFLEEQLRPIIGDRATYWARANPGLLTIGALSAGIVVAASPSVRRLLFRSARPLVMRRATAALRQHLED